MDTPGIKQLLQSRIFLKYMKNKPSLTGERGGMSLTVLRRKKTHPTAPKLQIKAIKPPMHIPVSLNTE
jgi:hypothetical protein